MTAINFTEPSKGEVIDSEPALTVINDGNGEGVTCVSSSDNSAALSGWQKNTTTTHDAIGVHGYSERGTGVRGETNSQK